MGEKMSKVEKKVGNTMTCGTCGNKLTCREKTYPASGNYAARTVTQWQNEDGSAHFKWVSDDNYQCVDKAKNEIPPLQPKHNGTQTEKCSHGVILTEKCEQCENPPVPYTSPAATQGDPPQEKPSLQILLNKFTVLEKDLKAIKGMVDANLAIASESKLMLNDMVKKQ